MAIFNKQVRYTTEQLLQHYPKRDSILATTLSYLYGIIRLISIIVQNLYCVSSYLVLSWIVLLPIGWFKSDLYSRLENYLYNSLLFIVSSWSLAAECRIVESGDEYKHLIEGPNSELAGYEVQSKPYANGLQQKLLKNKLHRPDIGDQTDSLRMKKSNGIIENGISDSSEIKGFASKTFHDDASKVIKSQNAIANGKRGNFNENSLDNKRTNTKICNGDQELCNDDEQINENGFDGIEYQVELASAAGERKLVNRSYRMTLNSENNNTLLNTSIDCNDRHHNTLNNVKQSHKLATTTTLRNEPPPEARQTKITQNDCRMGQQQQQQQQISSTSNLSMVPSASMETLKSTQAKPRVLFLCNHISTADVPLIMQSISTLSNQSILWVLDAQFKPTNFGVVCSSHGDFFVAKNSFIDGSLREQVLKHPDRNLLVLFPEGGFLRKRLEGSNRYATRNGYPQTKHVTHPRFGAFKDLIDPSVGVTHIVDATLFYDDIKNPLSILDIVLGTRPEPVILNYKLYKRSEIVPTEEWLRNVWLEKDKLLKKYYEDRMSLLKRFEETLRTVQLDWFKVLAVHLFYLLVCYLAIFRLFNATSTTMLKARELYYSNM